MRFYSNKIRIKYYLKIITEPHLVSLKQNGKTNRFSSKAAPIETIVTKPKLEIGLKSIIHKNTAVKITSKLVPTTARFFF